MRWALETAPHETLRGCRPLEIEVAYRAEALFGDTVVSRLQRTDDTDGTCFAHSLVHQATGRELTRLRTRWA